VLLRWQGEAPLAARASMALALSRTSDAQASTLALLAGARDQSREFADQWRLVQTASSLPSEAETDRWLQALVSDSDTWMLRAAALEALQARHSDAAERTARTALGDDYPRVRASALKVLASNSAELELLVKYAQEDKWFLVRAAALDALPDVPQARTVTLAALKDKTPAVRATAIRSLLRTHSVMAWPQIAPMLENAEEYPEVIAEGISFAKSLCVSAAVPSLKTVVKRGLQPDAWTPDQELALGAIDALSAFGGEAASWARDRAVGPLVPKQLHAAAAVAAQKGGICSKTPVL
jgi:HEAT repeat protein